MHYTRVQRFPPQRFSLTMYILDGPSSPPIPPPLLGQPTPRRAGLAGLRPSNAPRASGWMADTSRLASCTPNVRHSSFAPSPPGGDEDDDDVDLPGGIVLLRRRRRSAERAIIAETATAADRVQMITTDDLADDNMMVMSVSDSS